MLIMTAAEVAAAKLVAVKKEVKGTDFRNHFGARALVHKNKKKIVKKFDKRDYE